MHSTKKERNPARKLQACLVNKETRKQASKQQEFKQVKRDQSKQVYRKSVGN